MARSSPVCYDSRMSTDDFIRSPEFQTAVQQTLIGVQWLESLAQKNARWDALKATVLMYVESYTGNTSAQSAAQCRFLGEGKLALFQLCEVLAASSGPAALERALVSISDDVLGPVDPMPDVADVLRNAARAAADEDSVATAAQQRSNVPQLSTVSARAMPTVSAPALGAIGTTAAELGQAPGEASLAGLPELAGPGDLQRMCDQLRGAFNQLVGLLPSPANGTLQQRLQAWSESFSTPPAELRAHDAEMLEAGPLVLAALCKELGEMKPADRQKAFTLLESRVPAQVDRRRGVCPLARALIEVESLRAGEDNPHLKERRARFDEWARPQLLMRRITARECEEAMFNVGLEDWDMDYDGPHQVMDFIRKNATLRVCLTGCAAPDDKHPLSDAGKADLHAALVRLQRCCDDLMVTDATLRAFAENWLPRTASGEPDDLAGNLQTFGADALKRVASRLERPGDRALRERNRETLGRLLRDLAKAADPAATLLEYARYEVPHDAQSTLEVTDARRRKGIEDAVKASAAALLQGTSRVESEAAVARACRRLQQLLGVRAAAGEEDLEADIGGLYDTSAISLFALNDRLREAAYPPA